MTTAQFADGAALAERAAAVARAVLGSGATVERVEHGVSTYVFRINRASETFYLRILPEPGASFEPEARAQARLLGLGAKVPRVLFVDPCDVVLGLAIMITGEIAGRPIGDSPQLGAQTLEAIAREAGRDLALVNSVAVKGWGWIERATPGVALQAEHAAWRDVVFEHWAADLAFLANGVLGDAEVRALERLLVANDAWLDPPAARLAHGDLDATHIFQHNGRYSGIIDWGEIRGAPRWYDLGHFHIRDGERLPVLLEPALLRGYGEALALPTDTLQRVRFEALLINVRALARSLRKRPPDRWTDHQLRVLRGDIKRFL